MVAGCFFAFDGFVASGRRAVVAWREWRCCGDVRRFRWRCFAVACCKFVDNGICRSRGSGRMRGHVEGPSSGESVGESGPCRLPRTCSFSSSQNLRFEHNGPHRRSLLLRYFLTFVVLLTFFAVASLLVWAECRSCSTSWRMPVPGRRRRQHEGERTRRVFATTRVRKKVWFSSKPTLGFGLIVA